LVFRRHLEPPPFPTRRSSDLVDDTLTLVSWRARPRSFVALMGLYESNFIRLGWLVEHLTTLAGRHRSAVAGDCDLLLSVTERSPDRKSTRLNSSHGSISYAVF